MKDIFWSRKANLHVGRDDQNLPGVGIAGSVEAVPFEEHDGIAGRLRTLRQVPGVVVVGALTVAFAEEKTLHARHLRQTAVVVLQRRLGRVPQRVLAAEDEVAPHALAWTEAHLCESRWVVIIKAKCTLNQGNLPVVIQTMSGS